MNPTVTGFERKIGWAVLLALLAACTWMLLPFLTALLWAVILCYSAWPVYERLLVRLGGRRTLAALLMSLTLGVVILVPFVIIGTKLTGNLEGARTTVQRWATEGLPPPPTWLQRAPLVGGWVAEYWRGLGTDGSKLLEEAKRWVEPATSGLLRAGVALGTGLIQLALSIFMAFFVFRDGATAAARLAAVTGRIGGERGQHLLLVAGRTVRGVVYGILGTALLQAAMAGVGFFVAGVPGAGLLTLLVFFLSIIPGGPPLVLLPVVLWLFSQGATGWGVFMAVWGIVICSVDNFIKPWLISQGSKMPFLLIFLGVLGGALTFGFIGVFLGPTLMSVAARVVEEWNASDTTRDIPPVDRRPSTIPS